MSQQADALGKEDEEARSPVALGIRGDELVVMRKREGLLHRHDSSRKKTSCIILTAKTPLHILAETFVSIDTKFVAIDTKFVAIDTNFVAIDTNFVAIDTNRSIHFLYTYDSTYSG
jgi:hypothetical protein